MPKKFQGENSKAAEARARRETKKADERDRVEKQKEDDYWRDDDKNVQKKLQRKEERDRKKQETTERKQEAKNLLAQETEKLASQIKAPEKVTQAQYAAHLERLAVHRQKLEQNLETAATKIVVPEDLLEENVNRIQIEGDLARTVEEAIDILRDTSATSASATGDRHPEKRIKAAYTAFEEQRLPRLKADNPNLRLSQLKQMLKKEWLRSPENPLNQ